jgi:glucokinase
MVNVTNCPHWPVADGAQLANAFGMQSFAFINDFAAASYGLCMLKKNDYIHLNQVVPTEDGPRVVMGPGTGHGQGYLTRSNFGRCYEVYSSEGGHSDFCVTSEEDWKLRQFAI